MARLPLLDRDDLPEARRAIYDRLQASRGVPTGNIWRALANAPNLLDRILTLADELRHGVVIDRQFRELAVLMVGIAAKSRYEFDHHWNAAVKAGLAREKLESLSEFETSPLFDDAERAVLRYAREASLGEVSDATPFAGAEITGHAADSARMTLETWLAARRMPAGSAKLPVGRARFSPPPCGVCAAA